jgi:molybdenum cofactor synthesis domain-containing protein
MTNPTACMILIGNEILSGRTQDKNLSWLSLALGDIGINMRRAYVIPDVPAEIISTVNEARARYDYVFTTGGIGPTHDDITTQCVGDAFGVAVVRHAEAERILRAYYGHDAEKLNAARLKMADIPEGAALIDNPVSGAPGFRLGNVFVMAGVPSIMQGMFAHIRHMVKGGAPTESRQLVVAIGEGSIAAELEAVQQQFSNVEIGVYPAMREGKAQTTIVARSTDGRACAAVIAACETFLLARGITVAASH